MRDQVWLRAHLDLAVARTAPRGPRQHQDEVDRAGSACIELRCLPPVRDM